MLEPGTTIGPYRIEREIGRGGMGIVYLGHDSRLDRSVAIKALPDHLVADAERLARFEREARIVASLHHPGIAAVYALEHDASSRYLVMEYVEGETLAERLKRGPMPIDESLSVALAIAESLEAAHEKGIVHRDLKPGNVIIRPDGSPKVLDFGLARSDDHASTSASGPALSQSPTMTHPIHSPTIPGAIMGTAGYMSPEQARGKPVDKRSDVFSFGCVLYEMLTGNRPFHGETVADSLGATLHTDLDLSALPPATPARVRALVARCLQKDPRQRLRDIGEARIALGDPLGGPEPGGMAAPRARTFGAVVASCAIAALVVGVIGGTGLSRALRTAPAPNPVVASILVPEGLELGFGFANPTVPRLSPDGRNLLFGGRSRELGLRLLLTDLRTGKTRTLEGTENAQYPFWSPDSKSIGFFVSEHGLNRIDIAGGAPRELYEGEYGNGKGGSWSADGLIVFSPGPDSPLYSVPASGGQVTPISRTSIEDRELSHRHPFFLPRGDALLYVRRTTSAIAGEGPAQVWVRTLDGSVDKQLVESMGNAQYSRGHLLYVADGSLVARPFNDRTLSFTGEARRIVENIVTLPAASLAIFDATERGELAFVAGTQGPQKRRVVWRDRNGAQVEIVRENVAVQELRLIGGGTRLLAGALDAETRDLSRVVIDLATGRERTMEEAIPSTYIGCISPDGLRYAHWTNEVDAVVLLVQPVDSRARPTVVARIPITQNFQLDDWSPDGKALLGTVSPSGTNQDRVAVRIDLDGDGTVTPIAESPGLGFLRLSPSPNGKWIAFERIVRNGRHIFLMPVDRPTEAVRLSESSASTPRWRADSHELFFLGYDGVLSAVAIEEEPDGQPRIAGPVPLFDLGTTRDPDTWVYDVSPDGQRFILSEPMVSNTTQNITIMTDWLATLEQSQSLSE